MYPCLPQAEITFIVRWTGADGSDDGTINCYSPLDMEYNNLTTIEGDQRIFRTIIPIEYFRDSTGRLPKGGQQRVTIESPYFSTLTTTVSPSGPLNSDRVIIKLQLEWNRDTNQARFK